MLDLISGCKRVLSRGHVRVGFVFGVFFLLAGYI